MAQVFYTRDPTSNTTALPPPAASHFVVQAPRTSTPPTARHVSHDRLQME